MRNGLWRDLRKRYRALTAALIDVGIAVCLGALIEFVVVPVAYNSPWPVAVVLEGTWAVRNLSDYVADAMTRQSAAVPWSSMRAHPFVFVDIDQPTWTSWGSELITPRQQLAAAIDAVSQLGPAVVFVDVDLSFPLPKDDSDVRLRDLFRNYDLSTTRAPLVLVRAVISGPTASPHLTQERKTAYDSLVHSPKIIWASTLFEEGFDGVVRRWRLVEPVCVPGANGAPGAPKVLPSAQLALASIAERKEADLYDRLRRLSPPNCGTRQPSEKNVPPLELGPNRRVEFVQEEPRRRVMYSLDWYQPGEFESRPRFWGPNVDFEGRLVPLLTVLPIGQVLAGDKSDRALAQEAVNPALRDLFAGRIVVIGGSFEQSGDIHRTPLGPMPGAMIIINSVHALLSIGTPHEPRCLFHLTVSSILVVVAALLFHYLRPAIAAIVMAAVLLTLMRATLSQFHSGVILDLAVPAAGVLIHRQFLAVLAFVHAFRKKRWRALLAESEEAPIEH